MTDIHKKKIVIIGDGYVGKTCILHAIRQQKFEELQVNVYDEFYFEHSDGNRRCILHFVDTPGQEEYDALRKLMYRHVDLFIICFAVNDRVSYENIQAKWVQDINDYRHIPKILLGTKQDVRDNSPNCISRNEARLYQKKLPALYYVECSAKTGSGIDELINCILQTVFNNNKKTCSVQ